MLKIIESLILQVFQGFKGFEHKKCPFCRSNRVKKDGKQNKLQRYKCHDCHKRFSGSNRLHPDRLWQLYTEGKQTVRQLAERFCCSSKTICRHLAAAATKSDFATPDTVNLIMDTTYFGRHFGVMVLYDSISKQVLSVNEVKYETNTLYADAVRNISNKGIKIQSITCDGRRGLIQLFPGIPVQLCQFHQVKTVNRYLTRKPKTSAAQDLREVILLLKNSNRRAFEKAFLISGWKRINPS